MADHEWGKSTLNHGTLQCKHCLCTSEEALYALGDTCPKAPARFAPAAAPRPPYKAPRPLSEKGRFRFQMNIMGLMEFSQRKEEGIIK